VHWTVSDPQSQSSVQTDGCENGTNPADTPGRTITCTATSDGGVTARSLTYKKDSTAPSLHATLSPGSPAVGQAATAAPNATDATSGVAAQACGGPDTSSAGPHTVTCTARDVAGNQVTQTFGYTVAAATTGGGGTPGGTITLTPVVPGTPANPTFKASTAKVSSNGNVVFRVIASASGKVRIGAKAGKVRFRSLSATLTAGRAKTITLKLSKQARKAFKKLLRGGKKVKVRVMVAPAQGVTRALTLTVRRR
jgi:hypothetical protein